MINFALKEYLVLPFFVNEVLTMLLRSVGTRQQLDTKPLNYQETVLPLDRQEIPYSSNNPVKIFVATVTILFIIRKAGIFVADYARSGKGY